MSWIDVANLITLSHVFLCREQEIQSPGVVSVARMIPDICVEVHLAGWIAIQPPLKCRIIESAPEITQPCGRIAFLPRELHPVSIAKRTALCKQPSKRIIRIFRTHRL